MYVMRFMFLSIFWVFAVVAGVAGQKLAHKDLDGLVGKWEGTLRYIDYGSGEPYTLPAHLKIEKGPEEGVYIFWTVYPDEPNANNADTVRISPDGKKLNNESLTLHRKLSKDALQFITDEKAVDGNDHRPATIRRTYSIWETKFTIRKDVRYEGQDQWTFRHEYVYYQR